jgi:hypothetical protein|tara:strand:- start:2085 stop:3545 length:1461 start_codon:yes stop_codon:yes gene_type:complete
MVTKMKGYVPKGERKKIILMCDDIRTHSGIGTVAKEIVLHTAHKYNYLQVGAAINHPDHGKMVDMSEDINKQTGLSDAEVKIFAMSGYGNPTLVRQLLQVEKPDAIFLITDPRYWDWLFSMENEIRKICPIVYLNIWDDYPAPMYNKEFYESCDLLLGISKQTVNINKLVLGDKAKDKIISYVPHGLNHKIYFPIDPSYPKYDEFLSFKKEILGGNEYDFVINFNSRNIRRKQIPDTMWAYTQFVDKLPLEQAQKCAFLLHTQPIDNNGTDLLAVKEMLCGDNKDGRYNIHFSTDKFDAEKMNWMYNVSDALIQLTSNEGWGLSLTESLLVGNPIIANVTGGMQDQMRFEDNYGRWFEPNDQIPSNNTGTYKKHAPWAFPVFPACRSIQGSPPTPYIWDDRCKSEDAAEQILNVYNLGGKERQKRGELARKWVIGDEAGFTAERQGYRIIENLEKLFETWTPRLNYELIKIDSRKSKHTTPHNLIY